MVRPTNLQTFLGISTVQRNSDFSSRTRMSERCVRGGGQGIYRIFLEVPYLICRSGSLELARSSCIFIHVIFSVFQIWDFWEIGKKSQGFDSAGYFGCLFLSVFLKTWAWHLWCAVWEFIAEHFIFPVMTFVRKCFHCAWWFTDHPRFVLFCFWLVNALQNHTFWTLRMVVFTCAEITLNPAFWEDTAHPFRCFLLTASEPSGRAEQSVYFSEVELCSRLSFLKAETQWALGDETCWISGGSSWSLWLVK